MNVVGFLFQLGSSLNAFEKQLLKGALVGSLEKVAFRWLEKSRFARASPFRRGRKPQGEPRSPMKGPFGDSLVLWMDEILNHLRNPGF